MCSSQNDFTPLSLSGVAKLIRHLTTKRKTNLAKSEKNLLLSCGSSSDATNSSKLQEAQHAIPTVLKLFVWIWTIQRSVKYEEKISTEEEGERFTGSKTSLKHYTTCWFWMPYWIFLCLLLPNNVIWPHPPRVLFFLIRSWSRSFLLLLIACRYVNIKLARHWLTTVPCRADQVFGSRTK